jgi:hypothetical protein
MVKEHTAYYSKTRGMSTSPYTATESSAKPLSIANGTLCDSKTIVNKINCNLIQF